MSTLAEPGINVDRKLPEFQDEHLRNANDGYMPIPKEDLDAWMKKFNEDAAKKMLSPAKNS